MSNTRKVLVDRINADGSIYLAECHDAKSGEVLTLRFTTLSIMNKLQPAMLKHADVSIHYTSEHEWGIV